MTWEAVIGLEVHAQLLTRSKLFCACATTFGAPPNTHVCPVCLGLPGALPVLNAEAARMATKAALALGCSIRATSRFARKNYFYPDLPKGYQISQYDEPFGERGTLDIELADGRKKTAGIQRIHMEEDAGKNVHVAGAPYSLVDLNRAGVPLVEVVTEPDLRSAAEAAAYLRALRQLVRWLGICDGNMEEGSLRCDANVSIRPAGETKLGTRTELKNMNSFKHVERAIEYEIARQAEVVRGGGRVVQETRLWDADRGTSHTMRTKEEAHDYRYFPEPDLPPLRIADELLQRTNASLPELPLPRRARFVESLGLSPYDADVLTAEKDVADYYERVLAAGAEPKKAANWVSTELLARVNRDGRPLAESPVQPEGLAELIALVDDGTISGKIAKDVFEAMYGTGQGPRTIVESRGLSQLSDEGAIEKVVRAVLGANDKQVEKFRQGNAKLLGFFVGQVMKETGGKANPEAVNRILKRLLSE